MNIAESQTNAVEDNSEIKKSVLWIYYVIFFAVLNESVFNVSTPSIAEQFGLDASGVSWVVTIFFIVFGMGMVIFGKLSDIYSIKKLITIGISLYAFGSILGFVCQSWYPAVILSRAIQGAGGSAIPALIFVMVARFFTVKERGRMFGIITSTVSFAIGIGPVLGGYIAGSFHWAFLFLVSVPVVIAIPFFQRFLPVEPRKTGKLDVVGAVLLGIVISMLILFTTIYRTDSPSEGTVCRASTFQEFALQKWSYHRLSHFWHRDVGHVRYSADAKKDIWPRYGTYWAHYVSRSYQRGCLRKNCRQYDG
jgi:DHA2 family metal-tetracycline-proton antiporter-like MFS transporter